MNTTGEKVRPSKEEYYLDIARTVAKRSTCLRRNFGAIIVKNDIIISTGYNGAPRGRENCSDLKYCLREKMQLQRGERYELCRSVHAEANAIIAAKRDEMIGSRLYLACIDAKTGKEVYDASCCLMCKRLVINAGIAEVVVPRENEKGFEVLSVNDWITFDDSLSGISGY